MGYLTNFFNRKGITLKGSPLDIFLKEAKQIREIREGSCYCMYCNRDKANLIVYEFQPKYCEASEVWFCTKCGACISQVWIGDNSKEKNYYELNS